VRYKTDNGSDNRARAFGVPAGFVVAIAGALLTLACVQPSVRNIVGPSGQSTLFVTCGDTGECYELAGKNCPSGYDIQPARGAPQESYLVSCRMRQTPQQPYYAAQTYPPPQPVHSWTAPAPAPAAQSWNQAPPPAQAQTASSDVPNGLSFPRPIGSSEFDVGY
jgi:hypothetical protein